MNKIDSWINNMLIHCPTLLNVRRLYQVVVLQWSIIIPGTLIHRPRAAILVTAVSTAWNTIELLISASADVPS